ncbi:MAG TPA: O-methyltransferase [Pyrinomonadaceae bacterium]|jgi:caffeoyl-CoA O-methyltransferase|nr:O-methyltransferase [Pyrinomonadaceae bacterium]
MSYIDNPLTEYAEKHTSGESQVLQELRRECYEKYEDSAMLSGFYQGRVLAMYSKMIRPRVVLEIGTYLGYSALCFAEGLAEGGQVITLDVNEETNRVARAFAAKTQYADRIDFRLGPATEIIPTLNETFDLVFIDADKQNYSNYYNLIFDKLRPGGFIIADNVLWSGKVLDTEKDENTQALHDFNEMVMADKRISNVLLPIRDGLMIVSKN